jgi:hypothetical protein
VNEGRAACRGASYAQPISKGNLKPAWFPWLPEDLVKETNAFTTTSVARDKRKIPRMVLGAVPPQFVRNGEEYSFDIAFSTVASRDESKKMVFVLHMKGSNILYAKAIHNTSSRRSPA